MTETASITPALQVHNLTKVYKVKGPAPNKTALKGINLEVKQGSFFGLGSALELATTNGITMLS